MKKIMAILAILCLMILIGCKGKEVEKPSAPPANTGAAPPAASNTEDSKPAKIGNVPLETMGNFASIKQNDGICHNREYLSNNKIFNCMFPYTCAIDVNGEKLGTENYYISKNDCSADCDLDIVIDVCLKSDNEYQIAVDDGKGNFYNYALLYKGTKNIPLMMYGGGKGPWSLNLNKNIGIVGELQSLSIMPRFMNEDGTIVECSNHEKVFTSVESC